MFEESIFEGACATSTAEVLLIIAGSLGLGILLGYLIWGWLRRKVNELESRVIGLSKSVEDQESAIAQLETENSSLTDELDRSKQEFDLKSAQYTSAITRIRSLEENQADDSGTTSMKEEISKLEGRLKHQMEEIDKLENALKTAQAVSATTILPVEAEAADEAQPKRRRGRPKGSGKATKRKPGRPKKTEATASENVEEAPKRKRGRPKKTETPATEVTAEAPKRKRGRPKKTETPSAETTVEAPKRKRGRPKKTETAAAETTVEAPKRKRGRPKKTETAATETTVEAPKRKRGRPKKTETASAEGTTETPKMKRGRPKGTTNKKTRRKPGRPKKTETAAETTAETPKRKPGRPKKSEAAKTETTTTKKRRGRPKKSESASTTAKKTRSKRGRPKGSKNKPRVYRGADVNQDASQVFGKRIKQDDLTLIEGIGPKLASLFRDNGLETWTKVAGASQETLQQTVEKIGPRHHIHDPQTWPRQATMASKGEWKKLKAYQDSLTRGKKE